MNSTIRFDNRVAIVTGAGSGIDTMGPPAPFFMRGVCPRPQPLDEPPAASSFSSSMRKVGS